MKLILNPVRGDTPLQLTVKSNLLIFNGQPVDLAAGETCDWIVRAEVDGKEWVVEIILPHGPDAPETTRFPAPITVAGDGPVDLPPWGSADSGDLPEVGELVDAEPHVATFLTGWAGRGEA